MSSDINICTDKSSSLQLCGSQVCCFTRGCLMGVVIL